MVASYSLSNRGPSELTLDKDFDSSGTMMMITPKRLHWVTSPKDLAARNKLHGCFRDWYKSGHSNDSDVSMGARPGLM
jgi:hypothetical protein